MEKREIKKYKCVFCNYEMASRAIKPICTHCGSRRMNEITVFSSVKPYIKPKPGEDTMTKEKTEEKANQENITEERKPLQTSKDYKETEEEPDDEEEDSEDDDDIDADFF